MMIQNQKEVRRRLGSQIVKYNNILGFLREIE